MYTFLPDRGFDGTAFPATSVWGGWEYPALTRNPRVTKIIQVDTFKEGGSRPYNLDS
ncbi:uncharacterized protein BDW43DRAFT_261981 [Aspergillus alliaceus]|uniref:uncharacterized protein n=1 Tax=Petromyces alliaceus TaxID=209559 RepID=UPI0012A5949F|nr:uncharacterized protein BDW43DRAFT_261981 [Aspergillus alliaceus]KAB8238539.1 hypothetical protein BDW43DRAFT_261981 [Aspergillus alliaceus]